MINVVLDSFGTSQKNNTIVAPKSSRCSKEWIILEITSLQRFIYKNRT